MRHKDCIVIGGGIIGMSTARELALNGLTVSLFDKGQLGQQASRAAGGILSSMRPWSESPYSAKLSNCGKQCYANFVAELQQQTGIDTEYERCGLLIINQEDAELSKQWLIEQLASSSAPLPDLPTAMRVPVESTFVADVAQIRVPKLLQALHACLLQLGVEIFENTAIATVNVDAGGRCTAVRSATARYSADTFVIASGAWSQQLLEGIHANINIVPVRGQMLCVKFADRLLGPIVLDGGHYLIPRKDGHVLIGSSMEYVGFDQQISRQTYDDLSQWARSIWPAIADATFIKQWAGLRPGNDDNRPYLGKVAHCENVYVNAGHFRKGILQAPVCAQIIAEMIR